MHLILNLAICGILLLILVASFLYRKFIDDHDDHNIHLSGTTSDVRVISTQVEHARRIEMLDKVNKVLMVVVIVYSHRDRVDGRLHKLVGKPKPRLKRLRLCGRNRWPVSGDRELFR